MNAQDLRWEEWCFDQIGKELILCIHWEYARESPSIRALVARYAQLRKKFLLRLLRERNTVAHRVGSVKKERAQLQKDVRRLKALHIRLSKNFLGQFTNHFPEHFGSQVDEIAAALERDRPGRIMRDWRVALPIFATTFPGRVVLEPYYFPTSPWMALPLSVRERIARRVRPSDPILIEHRPWHKYSDTKLAHESQIVGRTGTDRWEDVALRIHWSEGTNEEIVSNFRKWITKYRKKRRRIAPPKRTRAAVTKAWLKRLGEMRLWKAGGGVEGALRIIQTHTQQQEREDTKNRIAERPKDRQLTEPISEKADEDSIREDISRVRKDLRRLFGWIVPQSELPVSYPFRRRRRD